MSNQLLFLSITCICSWAFLPRVFRIADQRCARQLLGVAHRVHLTRNTSKALTQRSSETFFTTLARHMRAQTPAREALTQNLTLLPSTDTWQQCASRLHNHENLDDVMEYLQCSSDEVAQLLALSYEHQSFNVDALEQAASILRARTQLQQSLGSATAQARITSRILASLPFALSGIAVLVSSSFRSLIVSPAGLAIALIGGALNRLGAWWISRLTQRVESLAQPHHYVQLVDSFCVAVKCGLSVTQACMRWEHVNEVGAFIAYQLKVGHSLHDSLQVQQMMSNSFGQQVVSTLVSAHLDGLPIHSTAHALAQQARAAQQASTDIAIRQLPSKLSFPLVLCVLPSFMLLTVAPMLLANLTRLHTSLPSSLS